MKTVVMWLVIGLATMSLPACGVALSTTAIVQAQNRFEAAKAAGAEEVAPYEYVMGVEYLRKAREEAGYADYQVAERMAARAQALFAEAARKASAIQLDVEVPDFMPVKEGE